MESIYHGRIRHDIGVTTTGFNVHWRTGPIVLSKEAEPPVTTLTVLTANITLPLRRPVHLEVIRHPAEVQSGPPRGPRQRNDSEARLAGCKFINRGCIRATRISRYPCDSMASNSSNRVVIPTGGAHKLGRAIALQLAKDRLNLSLFNLPQCKELLEEAAAIICNKLDVRVSTVHEGVSMEEGVKNL